MKELTPSMALEYGAAFGFPVWINRCGVLAGAGQFGKADQGIFSYWIHSWKAGRPLKYIGFGGTGKQVRDCLHPRDLVPLLLKQMRRPQEAQDSQNKEIIETSSLCPPVANASSPLCPPVPPVANSSHRIINVSGGLANSMSLLELSQWCETRFGPHPSSNSLVPSCASCGKSSGETRPFDIPWMVLDPSLAAETWGWHPATSILDILEEIALHAEANPNWLDLVT